MKYYFLKIGSRLLLWRYTPQGLAERIADDGKRWIESPSALSHISGMGDGDAEEITPEQARRVYSQLFPDGNPKEAIP